MEVEEDDPFDVPLRVQRDLTRSTTRTGHARLREEQQGDELPKELELLGPRCSRSDEVLTPSLPRQPHRALARGAALSLVATLCGAVAIVASSARHQPQPSTTVSRVLAASALSP